MLEKGYWEMKSAELGVLQKYLMDMGFASEMIDKKDGLPVSMLIAEMGTDFENEPWYVNFSYVLLPREVSEFTNYLNVLTLINPTVKEEQRANTDKIVNIINNMLIIGSFQLNAKNELVFRYVYSTPSKDVIDKDNFTENMILFSYGLQSYAEVIFRVSTGEMTVEEALESIKSE